MRDLLTQQHLPHLFDARLTFVAKHRVVEIALDIFMHKAHFKPACSWIDETAILRHVLLLDHSDFGVDLSALLVFVKSA